MFKHICSFAMIKKDGKHWEADEGGDKIKM